MASKKEGTARAVKLRTPAAAAAAAAGEMTYTIVLSKRYPTDNARYLKVDANPDVIIPTEEEVEVAENEYIELKNSAALRRAASRRIEKLRRETDEKGAAL